MVPTILLAVLLLAIAFFGLYFTLRLRGSIKDEDKAVAENDGGSLARLERAQGHLDKAIDRAMRELELLHRGSK